MKYQNRLSFFKGMIAGIVLFVTLLVVTKYLGIHLIPSASLADDVWERAKVVESYIDRYYWKDDTSDQTISEYAAKGMVAALGDKYSAYLTSQELKESMEDIAGDYEGIGAAVQMDEKTGSKTITGVQKGMPAEKAGLIAGDEIIKINGKEVKELNLSETVSLIKGEEGKQSVLTILRKENGQTVTKEITVVNEKIITQSVTSKMLTNAIGYVGVSGFDKETVKQFKDAIAELEKKKERGLIIDLRNNGGGSLTATIEMLNRMLPKGNLITEKNKVNGDKLYTSTDEEYFDKPVIVLINEGSASASEVFAGCMQDRKAATLLGTKSFGKGIVQTVFSLEKSCGGGIKLTTGEYLLPSKRCIQGEGLTPDVEVKYTGSSNKLGAKDDNQLQKALEVMEEKMAQ